MINLRKDDGQPDKNNLEQNAKELLPDYNPNTKMYDFIFQNQTFVRVCSTQPNFIINFHQLRAVDPSIEYSGFEVSINRATGVEVRGQLQRYPIGQLEDPILVSD